MLLHCWRSCGCYIKSKWNLHGVIKHCDLLKTSPCRSFHHADCWVGWPVAHWGIPGFCVFSLYNTTVLQFCVLFCRILKNMNRQVPYCLLLKTFHVWLPVCHVQVTMSDRSLRRTIMVWVWVALMLVLVMKHTVIVLVMRGAQTILTLS